MGTGLSVLDLGARCRDLLVDGDVLLLDEGATPRLDARGALGRELRQAQREHRNLLPGLDQVEERLRVAGDGEHGMVVVFTGLEIGEGLLLRDDRERLARGLGKLHGSLPYLVIGRSVVDDHRSLRGIGGAPEALDDAVQEAIIDAPCDDAHCNPSFPCLRVRDPLPWEGTGGGRVALISC